MLNSKIYKKYFPVKESNTHFSDSEKKILSNWIHSFKEEVKLREMSKAERGISHILTYNLDWFDENIMLDMLTKNQFDNRHLAMLNIIIYRHKYNVILSLYLFPILPEDKVEAE